MKRWIRYFGLLFGIAATAAVAIYATRMLREQDFSQFASVSAFTGIAIGTICYSLIIPISALAWRRLLSDMGTVRTWSELSIIMGVSQLAKYIPGNVGQHVGRAAMSISRGIPLRPYGISVVVETVLAVLAATLVGVVACSISGMDAGMLAQYGDIALPAIIVLGAAFVLALVAARHLLPRLLQKFLRKRIGAAPIAPPRNSVLVYALIAYIVNYAVLGTGIAAMIALLLPQQQAHWLLLTGSFAFAWVVGFFAPGAPAGLGVREGIMMVLLQFSYSQPVALLIVIALRIATTAGDVLCFVVGSIALLLSRRRASAAADALLAGDNHET
jgi:hypothetical protein